MKNKKVLYIALPVVAIIAIIAVLFGVFGAGANKASAVPQSTLGDHIPVDSDTVIITPSGETWWKTLASFTPIFFDLKSHAPNDSIKVNYYGYSRSPNNQKEKLAGTGPLQLLYLESPSPEDASGVATWLRENVAPDSKGMSVKTIDNVNVVSYNWATVNLEKTDKPLSKDPLFEYEVPLIWMNYDKMQDTLESSTVTVDPSDPTKTIVPAQDSPDVSSVLRSAVGITNGTVWKATSTDNGASWGGKFVAGGIDKNQIDPEKAQLVIDESSKVVLEAVREGGNPSRTALMTTGLTPLRSAFGLKYSGTDKTFGSANSELDGLSSVPGEIVSGSSGLGTQNLDMTMENSGSSPSSIDGSQISASETEMNVKFTDSGGSDGLYKK